MKNRYLLIAGVLCLFTAFLHLIGGQISLVHPLIDSNLVDQVKGEWICAWHMVTIVLFFSAYEILRPYHTGRYALLRYLGILFILFGLPSVCTSVYFGLLAPQFILLAPIGVLIMMALAQLKVAA